MLPHPATDLENFDHENRAEELHPELTKLIMLQLPKISIMLQLEATRKAAAINH